MANAGSTETPPGATRDRISLTASTASGSASTASSSHVIAADRTRPAARGSDPPVRARWSPALRPRGTSGQLVADPLEERRPVADGLVRRAGVGLQRLALGPAQPGRHRDVDDD